MYIKYLNNKPTKIHSYDVNSLHQSHPKQLPEHQASQEGGARLGQWLELYQIWTSQLHSFAGSQSHDWPLQKQLQDGVHKPTGVERNVKFNFEKMHSRIK